MPTMCVIDDRPRARKIIATGIKLKLKGTNWDVMHASPLHSFDDYPSWLAEHEISVLIVDEKLNESYDSAVPGGSAVSYEGHQLVDFLRKRMPSFPIFILTSYPKTVPNKTKGDVEDIIERDDFTKYPENYAPRFARASQRYLESVEQELAQISSFAEKIALGEKVSQSEQQKVQAIREKINLSFSLDGNQGIQSWVQGYEQMLNNLQELKQRLDNYLYPIEEDKDELEEN